MALHHAWCAKTMTSVRYLLKKGADPIIRSNNNAYTLLHVAAFLAKDILKLTNYSSITKRWTSIAWTTAGETRWIARSSTNKQTAWQREGIANRFKEKSRRGNKTKKYFKMNALIHRGGGLLQNRIFKYGFVLKLISLSLVCTALQNNS